MRVFNSLTLSITFHPEFNFFQNTYTAVDLSSVTVIDIPNVVENYSLTLRFAVGLWSNNSIVDGMQFICNCKVSDGISVVTSTTTITSRKLCTVFQPELNMLSNFPYIVPGDILLFQAEAYFTFETGNYTVNSVLNSVFIWLRNPYIKA